MTIRRTTVVGLVALLLTGCGGATSRTGPEELSPQTAFAAALARQSDQQPSSRVVSTVRVTTGGVEQVGVEQVIRTRGVVDAGRGLAEFEVEVPALGTLQQRLVGDVVYVEVPQRPRTWFSLPLEDLVGSGSGFGGDPGADVLEQLDRATRDVRKVGRQTVDGVDITHYRGTVDLAKSAAAVGGALGRLAAQVRDAEASFDVYLDTDGLVRRVTTTTTFTSPGVPGRITARSETVFTDYGLPVEVVPPPVEQVEDGSVILDALTAGVPD